MLRTYEGRRLHEKLQHIQAKLNVEAATPQQEEEEARDSKQILMDHLKAAGLDPSILEESNINPEEEEEFGMANNTNESFDNEDDEDDEDDDEDDEEAMEAPASSSSGIEELQSEHSHNAA